MEETRAYATLVQWLDETDVERALCCEGRIVCSRTKRRVLVKIRDKGGERP